MASFLSPRRAKSRLRYKRGSGFSLLASPYGPRTGGGNTGLPLKKVSPYLCSSLALNAWILIGALVGLCPGFAGHLDH